MLKQDTDEIIVIASDDKKRRPLVANIVVVVVVVVDVFDVITFGCQVANVFVCCNVFITV